LPNERHPFLDAVVLPVNACVGRVYLKTIVAVGSGAAVSEPMSLMEHVHAKEMCDE
jgi:hypothetical protein